jgi:hypothetical protein
LKRAGHWWNTSTRLVKSYTGYDGSPSVEELTNGFISYMDLTKPQTFNKSYDCVMSISVGEVIPKQFEKVYVENVLKPVEDLLVVSWAQKLNRNWVFPNEKSNEEVIAMFEPHGMKLQKDMSRALRVSAVVPWYKSALMVFTKERPVLQKARSNK